MAASLGVIGYQSGWAFGYLIPPLVITGPIETFKNISGFNGTYPEDWKNTEKWNLTEQATEEVKNQIMYMFVSFTGICILVLVIMIFLVTDGPKLPPSRAFRRQTIFDRVMQKIFCPFSGPLSLTRLIGGLNFWLYL